MSDQNKAPLSLFQGYGVEIEYMVVDAESREIRSIVDTLLDDLERSPDASTRTEGNPSGRVEWSNELAAHVAGSQVRGTGTLAGGLACPSERQRGSRQHPARAAPRLPHAIGGPSMDESGEGPHALAA